MRPTLPAAALLSAFILTPAAVPAAGDAALVDYRQQTMKAAAGHLRAAKAMAVEGLRIPGHLETHAEALERIGTLLPGLFPAGSGGGDSDAKSEIWSDPDGFAQAVDAYADAVESFTRAAELPGKAAKEGYYRVQESCKGCHKKFRER